jgi:hypothetical protein
MAASLRIDECLVCTKPEADDVRHALGQGALDGMQNMSPSGRPIMCCRVKVAGTAPAASAPGERRL